MLVSLMIVSHLSAQSGAPSEDRGADRGTPGTDEVASESQVGGAEAEAASELSEGLWPSRSLLRLALTRFVDDACDRYELDEDQREALRDRLVGQWVEYLSEHRAELQPLLNEFLEMRLDLEPPSPERVKGWAERAIPAFEDVRGEMERSWGAFREVLTPVQRAKFEVELLGARAGLGYAGERLTRWREGSFEQYEVWEPREREAQREARAERRHRRAERREQIEKETKGEGPDQIEQELDRWDRYVADFVSRYQLDEGQRSAALSLLSEIKRRAKDHRERYRDDIVQLERRIERGLEGDDEREAIKNELVRLYGPVDELFAELEQRLEPIPTERQRRMAEEFEDRETVKPRVLEDDRTGDAPDEPGDGGGQADAPKS